MIVNAFECLTHIADQGEHAEFLFPRRGWRKLHFPEILDVIEERNAVSVYAGVLPDLADHADLRFFITFGPAKNHLLFGREFVLGKKPGTVKAEKNGFRLFGKNPARQIGADQDDGNLFGDASASSHNLLWQEEGHNRTVRGPISYLSLFVSAEFSAQGSFVTRIVRINEAKQFQIGTCDARGYRFWLSPQPVASARARDDLAKAGARV